MQAAAASTTACMKPTAPSFSSRPLHTGSPRYRLTRGGSGTGEAAARVSRIPAGHPEGYLEGFANIYAEAARAILARKGGTALDPAVTFPGLAEGVEGVAFVDACVRSSAKNAAWVKLAL